MIIKFSVEAAQALQFIVCMPGNEWERKEIYWPQSATQFHLHTLLEKWIKKNIQGESKSCKISVKGPDGKETLQDGFTMEIKSGSFSMKKDLVEQAEKELNHYKALGSVKLPASAFHALRCALRKEEMPTADEGEDVTDAEALALVQAEEDKAREEKQPAKEAAKAPA